MELKPNASIADACENMQSIQKALDHDIEVKMVEHWKELMEMGVSESVSLDWIYGSVQNIVMDFYNRQKNG